MLYSYIFSHPPARDFHTRCLYFQNYSPALYTRLDLLSAGGDSLRFRADNTQTPCRLKWS